jgi:PAS domain S-box-containing protein
VSRLVNALRDAADGAFVIDEEMRISFWNAAAEEILGFDEGDVAGQFCYRILQGYDEYRQLICKEHCRVAELTLKAEPVPNYDVQARTKEKNGRWLNMSVFTYPGGENGEKKLVVHLFRDIDQKEKEEAFFRRVLEIARRFHTFPSEGEIQINTPSHLEKLTPREEEVLTFLVQGYRTREIAQSLSISPNTVRNHIQHILQKLQVHTRLEAVAYAIKHKFVD